MDILRACHIEKKFPGDKALDDVQLELGEGEIHALMGENGAGKSTLIKVLTGVYPRDKGDVFFRGELINPKTPQEAQELGISTVYQEVNLCTNLTVAENIYIGREPKKHGHIDWKKMEEDAKTLLERLNIHIDVKEELAAYSIGIQQMVAIARSVDISSGLLILDEPTSSLDAKEVEELFRVMRQLKEEGMSILFITHFIDQVYAITDKITVLRNGAYVGTYETESLAYMELVSKMIGRTFTGIMKESRTTTVYENKEVFLRMDAYGRKGKISHVDLTIHQGEVLGLAGLLGSGRSEVARLLFGIDKNDEGVIEIGSDIIRSMYPQQAMKQGMGYCPEDRKVEGIIGELSVRENMILALQAKQGLVPAMSKKEQEKIARHFVELLHIKVASLEQSIESLSGGNQQKVILGRWLATHPRLLILDEPTRGIDIGSRTEIQKLILELAKEGMTILMISSELEETVAICDRVIVLRDRQIIGEIQKDNLTEDAIMSAIAEGEVTHEYV